MQNYNDQRISFPIPEGWRVSDDKTGNIFYVDPTDDETWCFVEFSGLKQKTPDKPVPSAWDVLAETFKKELLAGVASLSKLDENRALIEWPEETVHDGKEFLVYHFQLGSRVASGDVQLANFPWQRRRIYGIHQMLLRR
ncbi:MAG TPA: hypothetical protein VF437_05950 [Verrucomicrobiae bacterium]